MASSTHATVTKGGVATALIGHLPAVGTQAPTVLGANHELKDITLDSDELKGKVKILNVKYIIIINYFSIQINEYLFVYK
jgi:peroxiredoxin